MRVVFYKGDKPLDEEECPHIEFTDPSGGGEAKSYHVLDNLWMALTK
jgi:hypothetical protein